MTWWMSFSNQPPPTPPHTSANPPHDPIPTHPAHPSTTPHHHQFTLRPLSIPPSQYHTPRNHHHLHLHYLHTALGMELSTLNCVQRYYSRTCEWCWYQTTRSPEKMWAAYVSAKPQMSKRKMMSLCVASWCLFRLNFLFLSMLWLSLGPKNTCFSHPKNVWRWFDLQWKEITFGHHKISWIWSDCPWELASFGHHKIRWKYSWVSTKKTPTSFVPWKTAGAGPGV